MNWKTKILIQKALSLLPVGESLNHRLQWLNGGYTNSALHQRILDRLPVLQRIAQCVPIKNSIVVEVGTGWELLDPLLLFVLGARQIHTYDQMRHLRFAIPSRIVSILNELRETALFVSPQQRARIQELTRARNLQELFSLCNISYMAPCDASQTGLPSKSVDLFFSIQVLEHVPPSVLAALINESRRIMKPDGIAFHLIDPSDHYCKWGTSKVNFLKYSDRTWNFWVQNKISYHNRLRACEFIDAFVAAGCQIRNVVTQADPSDVALLQNGFKLNRRFAGFTPEQLAVHSLEVVHS